MITAERLWFVAHLSENEACLILSGLRMLELSDVREADRQALGALIGRFMSAVGEARGEVDGCG